MANKAALAVLGVIVLVSMGVGILIGMQLDGNPVGQADDGGGDDEPTPIPMTTTEAPTPIPTASTPTQRVTTTNSRTQTPARTTVPTRRFDKDEISTEIKQLVNQRRSEEGGSDLVINGDTVTRLELMASDHSDEMADEGRVSHFLNGQSSADRYRNVGLFEQCKFSSASDSFIIDASDSRLEVIAKTVAGRTYETQTGTDFNANETAVARAIVDEWWGNPNLRQRLTYQNADQLGVGVEVTQGGDVYVTGNIC